MGCSMLVASALPWLRDPLGTEYSAWQLPVDIGWQFRTGLLNYGLLCFCCALYAWLIAYAQWRPFRGHTLFAHSHLTAGMLCIVPLLLFLLQYLSVDMQAMALLAQHKAQALLIQQHFGYRATPQLIPLSPFTLNSSTLWGRVQLLIDSVSFGLLCPCGSAWIGIEYRRISGSQSRPVSLFQRRKLSWLLTGIFLLLLIFGRAPTALVYEYTAKVALSRGDYASALYELTIADILNPSFEQVAFYHRERGEALYFLAPMLLNDDSRAYLASVYQDQRDFLDAYQQLLIVWRANPAAPWVREEMSNTLERLVEGNRPLAVHQLPGSNHDEDSLPWLQLLTTVDPTNSYSLYLRGRIYYTLHSYSVAAQQMSLLLGLSSDADIRSSAWTYMALSDAGQGDYAYARLLLFKAIALDPSYRNNTAREELSGLH